MVAMATGINYDIKWITIRFYIGKSPKVWRKTDTNSRSGKQIYGGVTPFGFLGLTQHSLQNNLSKLFYEISKQKYNFFTKTVHFRPKMTKFYLII